MNLFEAVKTNVSAGDVATLAGLHPNRNKMICCPFHNDRHPSMKVDKRYFCLVVEQKATRLILRPIIMG